MDKFPLSLPSPASVPPDFTGDTKWLVCADHGASRCLIIRDGDKTSALDENGDPILEINPILDLFACLPPDLVFDGGILNYKDEEDFQYLVSDCLTLDEFYGRKESPVLSERLERMKETADAMLLFKDRLSGYEHLFFVPHLIADEGVFAVMRAGMTVAGWKGIILRKNVPYESGRTGNTLIYTNEKGETLV